MPDPVALALDLMQIPSVTGTEGAVVAWVATRLADHGWTVVEQPVSPGRANLLAFRDAPLVVFSTHLDTVPPLLPVWRSADALHGRGACDAKGIAAAMMVAAERLVAEGETRIGLLFLVGEEDGSDGARAAAGLSPKGRYLINGEPTENRLVIGQKGALRATLSAQGRAAHSGYPHLGESAIDSLLDTLARIRAIPLLTDPVLGDTTLNIGRLHGGEAPNVLAPSATAELMWRTVTDTTALRAAVRASLGSACRIDFTLELPVMQAPTLPGWQTTTVAYGSDLPFLGDWGVGYQLGPGSIHQAHTDGEHLLVSELHAGVEAYLRLAHTLLAEASR